MKNIIEYLTPKSETYYINNKTTIRQALEKFDFHKFSVVSVIDSEGKFISTISEGDILRVIKNDYNFDISLAIRKKIDNIPRYRPYEAIGINSSFDKVLKLSIDQNFIPIVDDRGIYMGIIKRSTILNEIYKGIIVKK